MEALRNRGFWFDMICFAAVIVVMVTACVQIRKYAGIAYDFGSNIVRTDAKDKGEDILTIEVVIDDMLPRIVWVVGAAIEVGINNLSFIFKAENCTRVIIIGHVRF